MSKEKTDVGFSHWTKTSKGKDCLVDEQIHSNTMNKKLGGNCYLECRYKKHHFCKVTAILKENWSHILFSGTHTHVAQSLFVSKVKKLEDDEVLKVAENYATPTRVVLGEICQKVQSSTSDKGISAMSNLHNLKMRI